MKTVVFTVLIIFLTFGILNTAFVYFTPVSNPSSDLNANQCQQVFEKAAEIDKPSRPAETFIMDQAAACERAGFVGLNSVSGNISLLAGTSDIIPITGDQVLDTTFAKFKVRPVGKMMGME